MSRRLKFLALALMLGLAMVYGSPGKAYASPHAPAMAPLSTALIGDIDTALASGDPAAALLQLSSTAVSVGKLSPSTEGFVHAASIRTASSSAPTLLIRKHITYLDRRFSFWIFGVYY